MFFFGSSFSFCCFLCLLICLFACCGHGVLQDRINNAASWDEALVIQVESMHDLISDLRAGIDQATVPGLEQQGFADQMRQVSEQLCALVTQTAQLCSD